MIKDVKTKELKLFPDERGFLVEMLRSDDDIFKNFGQTYLTRVNQGVVKAWHLHRKQYDNVVVVKGMMKIVLYDDRKDSSTYKEVNEFFMGEQKMILLQIPPGVMHGMKAIGGEMALAVNHPTEAYDPKDPDEERVDPHNNDIPYEWGIKEQ
jgi:dTDP-4-dehydrorhamnose 3,5-epimerase